MTRGGGFRRVREIPRGMQVYTAKVVTHRSHGCSIVVTSRFHESLVADAKAQNKAVGPGFGEYTLC